VKVWNYFLSIGVPLYHIISCMEPKVQNLLRSSEEIVGVTVAVLVSFNWFPIGPP